MRSLDKEAKALLESMVANTSVAFVVSDPRLPDNPIVLCNDAFLELTGYEKRDVIGKNCRFLMGEKTEAEKTRLLVNAIKARQPILVELTNYKQDGSTFLNAVMIAPMFDEAGELAYYLGSQIEIKGETFKPPTNRQKLAIELIKSLTPQQKRVLTLVAKGYMNKQIAHILKISERTVKMHRAEALAKLNVSNTAEAIRVMVEAGL